MKIGYARVSTKDQQLDLQLDALQKAGCKKIYQEVRSGAKSDRPILQELFNNLREEEVLVLEEREGGGDPLVCPSMLNQLLVRLKHYI